MIETVVLAQVESGDGSFSDNPVQTPVLARVVDLQPNEIKRLMDKGITIQSGISVAIVGELVKAPDQIIRANGTIMKVVDFTISENATVLACDVMPLGAA